MGILSTAALLRLTYLSTNQDPDKDHKLMDDQWLAPRPLRNRDFEELSPSPSDTGSLEVCAVSSKVGVATNNFWTRITPEKDAEDKEGLAVVAAIMEIFAKRKKRDKMKRKQAVMSKELRKKGVTIKHIIQECSKAEGSEEEKTEATNGGKSDDEMRDGAKGSKTHESGGANNRDDKIPMDGSTNDGDNNNDKNRNDDDDSKDGTEAEDDDKEDDKDEDDGNEDDKEKEKAFDVEMKALDWLYATDRHKYPEQFVPLQLRFSIEGIDENHSMYQDNYQSGVDNVEYNHHLIVQGIAVLVGAWHDACRKISVMSSFQYQHLLLVSLKEKWSNRKVRELFNYNLYPLGTDWKTNCTVILLVDYT